VPELPDFTIYLEALERRILGQLLMRLRIASQFLLRTAVPLIQSIEGRHVVALRRLGKRIVFGFEDDLWLMLHLMIAGRLHWFAAGAQAPRKSALALFESAVPVMGSFTLRCVQEWWETSGTGRGRSNYLVREEVWSGTWQLESTDELPASKRREFSFVPAGDAISTNFHAPKPVYWEFEVKLEMSGPDFIETYLVPVYE
jgi:hypothetical protein